MSKPTLKDGLYSVYVKLFEVVKEHPGEINNQCLTELITWLLSSTEGSWLVVGITEGAFSEYAKHGFGHKKGIFARGHLVSRARTRERMFDGEEPLSSDEFWGTYHQNNKTVLMLNSENETEPGPDFKFIEFKEPSPDLFPNRAIGWGHRKRRETIFLREMWERLNKEKSSIKLED